VTAKSRTLLILGLLMFGLLTFVIGLLLGFQLGTRQTTPAPAGQAAAAPPAAALPAAVPPAGGSAGQPAAPGAAASSTPAAGSTGSGPGAGPAAAPPGSPAAAPASPAPPAPAPAGAAPADQAAKADKPLQDVRSGPIPGTAAKSFLVGPTQQLAAAPTPLPAAPPPPVDLPPGDRIIAVQVGRFLLPETAEALARSVTERGWPAKVQVMDMPELGQWHLVIVGPQPDEMTARKVAASMAAALDLNPTVVSWPAKPAPSP
jgi:hypothetical protein